MRYVAVGLAIALLTGCSKAPDHAPSHADGRDAGPDVAVTAAPGVAFSYRYAFRLPSDLIASAQEGHAQACERLGIARCRITGMRYRLLGENDVEAMLSFKLEPTIARAFGKNAIAFVEQQKGTLVDAEITGDDAGAAIDRLATTQVEGTQSVQRIDAELAKPNRSSTERAELQRQRTDVARQVQAAQADAAVRRDSLAHTPMTFDYGSGPAIRGFDTGAPLTSAIDVAVGSAQATLAVVLGAIAILGPPGLVAFALFLLWRRFRPKLP